MKAVDTKRDTTSSEEELQKRCQRCGLYYQDVNNCRFHSGKFKADFLQPTYWRCCKSTKREAIGMIPSFHSLEAVEWENTSKISQRQK